MTPSQLHILQHALGVDKYGQGDWREGKTFREHFCASGADETICRELVAIGYMRTWTGADERGQVPGYPYYNCSVTDEGRTAVRRESPAAPKLTASQKRYREFLEADTGYSFGEWLKSRSEWLKRSRMMEERA